MSGMTRRGALNASAAFSIAAASGKISFAQSATTNMPLFQNELAATRLIDHTDRRIIELAARLAGDATDQAAIAVKLHDWVRDEIPFGIAPAFYDMRATEVLEARIGYCNTKSTLLKALLRARGIPTRLRVVDLSASVLRGLFDPGTPYVDHAITEIFLKDRWLALDSMVVDSALERVARAKLQSERAITGWGIHINGAAQWSGTTDRFIQAVDDGSIAQWIAKDHGYFADIEDFYAKVDTARNRKTVFNSLMLRVGASALNRRIDAVRRSA